MISTTSVLAVLVLVAPPDSAGRLDSLPLQDWCFTTERPPDGWERAGFSYVQLYDVEGEVNGYLTYDRRPKLSPEAISAIHAEGLRRREGSK